MKYLVLAYLLFQSMNAEARVVKLAWDETTDTTVIGFRLYYVAGTDAPVMKDCGNVTQCEVDIPSAVPIEFYATAYNAAGLESEKSNSVLYWEASGTPISLTSLGAGRGFELAWMQGPSYVTGYQVTQGIGTGTNVSWNKTNVIAGYTNRTMNVSQLLQGTNFFRMRPIFVDNIQQYTSDWSATTSIAPPKTPSLRIVPPSENILQVTP